MNNIYDMPGHLIRRAQQISSAIFAEECAAFDLTSIQYAALWAIRFYSDLDATRLSRVVAFDRATIGGVLARIEAKGWVVRTPSATDKRVKLLRLTPAGEELLDRVEPAVARVQERLLEPLAPADRTAFMRMMGQLADVYNDITSAPYQAID